METPTPGCIVLEEDFLVASDGSEDQGKTPNDGDNTKTSSSPWNEGCEFRCLLCDAFLTGVKRSLFVHLQSDHKVTALPNETEGMWEAETKEYECLECSNRVLWEREEIRKHLQQIHKMSVPSYEAKHSLGTGLLRDTVEFKGSAADDGTRSWNQGSDYKCKKCHFVTTFKRKICSHMFQDHGTKVVDEGNTEFIMRHHLCLECGRKVLCERDAIRKHLQRHHRMTTAEYGNKHGLLEVGDDIKEEEEQTNGDSNKASGHDLLLPQLIRKFWKKEALSSTLLGDTEEFKEWSSDLRSWKKGCDFTCKLCGTTTQNKKKILSHMTKSHHTNAPENTVEVILRHHVCLECGRRVLCEQSYIKTHLKARHSSCIEDYESKHGLISGETKLRTGDESSLWFRGCEYRCKLCPDYKRSAKRLIQKHLLRKHDLGRGQTEDKCEVVVVRHHTCRECGKELLCERKTIQSHLRSRHKSTMEIYESKHGISEILEDITKRVIDSSKKPDDIERENVDTEPIQKTNHKMEPVTINDSEIGRVESCKDVAAENKRKLERKGDDDLESSPKRNCRVHEIVPKPDQSEPVKEAKTSLELFFPSRGQRWFQGCDFRCFLCDDLSTPYRKHAELHAMIFHKVARSEAKEKIEAVIRHHACLDCGASVVCDRISVSDHLIQKHGITMSEYSAKHNLEPTTSVPTSPRSSTAV